MSNQTSDLARHLRNKSRETTLIREAMVKKVYAPIAAQLLPGVNVVFVEPPRFSMIDPGGTKL